MSAHEIGEGELAAPLQLRIFDEFKGGSYAIHVETPGKVASESRSRAAPREDGAAFAAAVGAQHIVDIIAEVTRLNGLRRYPAKPARVSMLSTGLPLSCAGNAPKANSAAVGSR